MSSSSILSISSRRGVQHLSRQRRTLPPLPLNFSSTTIRCHTHCHQRHFTTPSSLAAQAGYRNNRRISYRVNNTLCYFSSSASTIDDEENDIKHDDTILSGNGKDDEEDANNITPPPPSSLSSGGGDIDALQAAIDRLKLLEPDDNDDAPSDGDGGGYDDDYTPSPSNSTSSNMDMLNVMKSSPFNSPSETTASSPAASSERSIDSLVDAAIEALEIETPPPSSKADDEYKEKKPSLSELLQTDIYTQSWSEESTSDSYDNNRSGRYVKGGGYTDKYDFSSSSRNDNDYYRGDSRKHSYSRNRSGYRGDDASSYGSRNDSYTSRNSGYRSGNRNYDEGNSYNLRSSSYNDKDNDYYSNKRGEHSTMGGYMSGFDERNNKQHANQDSLSDLFGGSSSYDDDAPSESTSSWGDYSSKSSGNISSSYYQSYQGADDAYDSQPSQAKLEYDKILEQSDNLLRLLSSKDDDSSTLQLNDFDTVMTQWSRFHGEIETDKNDESGSTTSDSYSSRGYNDNTEDESLKQKASEQCMKLLNALESNYDCILHHALPQVLRDGEEDLPKTKHSKLIPNAASYNLALHALAHSNKGESVAQEAYSILDRMLERCEKYLTLSDNGEEELALPRPPFEPTIITYNSVVHAIAKSGAKDAGHLAEEVFGKMEEWRSLCEECKAKFDNESGENATKKRITYNGVLPNSRTLACVIDAWANAKTTNQKSFAPERAEAILDLAVKRRRAYVESVTGKKVGIREEDSLDDILEEEGDESDEDEDVTFIFADDEDIVEESIDEEFQEDGPAQSPEFEDDEEEITPLHQSEFAAMPALRPNTVAFNSCIHAWANSASSRGREGVIRAQALLSQLEALSESGELDLPSVHSSDIIIDDNDDSSDVDNSLKPNARTYSVVMNAWANLPRIELGSGEFAATHCEEILNRMEQKGAVDVAVRPNLVAYVTTISAWARASDQVEHAASRAENILNRMIDLYYNEDETELPILDGDIENPKHDAPFNSVITAYARSSDPYAADRALAILQRLEASSIPATVTSYNAAMDVCAKHGEPEKALKIFDKLKESSIVRDSTSYDTVLNAFAREDKAGSAERAYDFLCQLEEEQSLGDSNFTPSSVSYTTVLNAFARASGKEYGGIETVRKAKEVYDKLIKQMNEGVIYGDADPFANSCFLNCCASIHGTRAEKKEALVTAITAFEEMKKQPDILGTPNQFTYGTMMKACTRLSSDVDEKNRLLESLFIQACKQGVLSRAVLGQFLRHTPSHLNSKAILSLGGSKRDIPESWHCNVPRKHWPIPTGDTDHRHY